MESLFSLILVGKAEVFVICMVQIKLSIVLLEVRCCITSSFYRKRRQVFTTKSRVGLTRWGKFDKDEKLLMKSFGLIFFFFCFSVALFPMFANSPGSCVSTRQWVFFEKILVLFRLNFFLEILFSCIFKVFFNKRSTSHW